MQDPVMNEAEEMKTCGQEGCACEQECAAQCEASQEPVVATTEEAKEPTIEELLVAMKAENDKLQDMYMRALAEMENGRRRAEESVEKAHKFGVEKFAKNLLPVLDSLEKALELSADKTSPMMQGVEATYRQFIQAMESSGMVEINPVGEAFDPTRHQAISMVPPQEGQGSGVVAQVYQRGWILNERVLRAAMVSVTQ